MIYYRSSKPVAPRGMKSGFEPPLSSGLVSSPEPVAVLADSWSGQSLSAVFCFASLCLSACASPASGPVFAL